MEEPLKRGSFVNRTSCESFADFRGVENLVTPPKRFETFVDNH